MILLFLYWMVIPQFTLDISTIQKEIKIKVQKSKITGFNALKNY